MSSSAPMRHARLAADLAALGIALIDAPVSGGVKRARRRLARHHGGRRRGPTSSGRGRCSQRMGKSDLRRPAPSGSGHAVKALNNYVSAAGLAGGLRGGARRRKLRRRSGRARRRAERLDRPQQFDRTEDEAVHPVGQLRLRLLHGADGEGPAARRRPRRRTRRQRRRLRGPPRSGPRPRSALGTDADHTEIYRYLAARSGPQPRRSPWPGSSTPPPPRWGRSPNPRPARTRCAG